MRLIALLLAILLPLPAMAADTPAPETAYDRVMRTGILRCGYILVPPQLGKDPNTGQLSGLMVDVMNEIGKRLNLDIRWTEEVNFATMSSGLQTGRYDAICFSLYRLPSAAKVMAYTRPLFYSATDIYVRSNDHRFDAQQTTRLNSPDISIATIDAEMSAIIAQDSFPHAKTLSLPAGTDITQLLLNVADGKADVTFVNRFIASGFLVANPGRVRNIEGTEPLRVFSHGIAYAPTEIALGQMLNNAIDDMNEQGKLNELLTAHELLPETYMA